MNEKYNANTINKHFKLDYRTLMNEEYMKNPNIDDMVKAICSNGCCWSIAREVIRERAFVLYAIKMGLEFNVGACIQTTISHADQSTRVALAVPSLITELIQAAGVNTSDDTAFLDSVRPLDKNDIHQIWNNQAEEGEEADLYDMIEQQG
ncbi:hypothetical protein L484_025579 [Morus notabilis]|uniref:Uncharacterized protein n=1 Tax=Morus notabilis TaxID=981085 RepID=W9R8J5_9ROSA|nr:hypothetical protein L484_025579 [Morus notabilis]